MTAMLTPRKCALILAGYVLLSCAVLVTAPFFGSEPLAFDNVVDALFSHRPHVDADIFFYHRIPRVLLAFLVGGSLAVAGSALQVVLRNPLAEPFILGVAGGGAVGAVIAISVPGLLIRLGPFSSVQLLSLLGCILCICGIYRLASRPVGISMTSILLAGVTINILCGAAILLVRYLVSPHLLVAMDRWMMGGLDVIGYRELSALLPLLLPGLALLFIQGPALNLLAFGEDMATGHGVNVASVQKQILAGTGLATAAAVSLAGPIGFVGLIIPHAVRRLSGVDHRVVLPASFCLGGAFLTVCDLVARTVVAPTEMPVGIITAIIGGPIFLRILLKGRRRE
ncbi:MAG: iron ABC transporter permease [Deltaproteobacteria bacterium]|nr:iron ABC transporter permease [Deltaproteobacteria bacterium]